MKLTSHRYVGGANRFITDITGIDPSWTKSNTTDDIYPLVRVISGMLKKKQYFLVNLILDVAPIENLSVLAMVTLIRTTYPARNKLRKWNDCLSLIKKTLKSKNEDWDHLLRGLT